MTEKKSKICSKCKQEKSLCDFYKSATKKFGVQSQCKKCRNELDAKYRRENPEKIRAYFRKRYKNDENFRVVQLLRNRFWKSLKSQSAKKSKRTLELAGCRIDELWKHLEKQFKDGMTRQNQGEWHIDHIKPCSLFDLTDPEQQKECFNYKNLQPLWAEENLRKGAKW